MNNKKSSMIDMKPENAIKLDIARLDQTYQEENVPPEVSLHRYLCQPGERHRNQKRQATDFI